MKTLKELEAAYETAAVWTPDCQQKQDFDGEFISVSCRAYPPRLNQNEQWSCFVSLSINLPEGDYRKLVGTELFAPTESKMKVAVEDWVTVETRKILGVLAQAGYELVPD